MDFIENGGKYVENVIFSTGYDDNYKGELFVGFVKRFQEKYGKTPSVFAVQGYELEKILIYNLKQSTDFSTLKQRILEVKEYTGLQGNIVFDKYGDVSRKYFLMHVKNKKFQKIN